MKTKKINKNCCPICGYELKNCQCIYDDYPERQHRCEVVLDHLYMLSKKQLRHIMKVQQFQQTSYADDERSKMLDYLNKTGSAMIFRGE